jgi:hypothetical protein
MNMMLRKQFLRSFSSVGKRAAVKTVSTAKTIASPPKTRSRTVTKETETAEDDGVLFDPPEFNLQVGQSQRNMLQKDSGLKSQTLDELFKATLHDNPEHDVPGTKMNEIAWPTSYYGLGVEPFKASTQEVLSEKIDPSDIEIKPDGLIYLPEIKYRRILNRAFGAGGWGLVPRSETIVTDTLLTREYALVCLGRLVSIARGEQDYFSQDGIPTATEGCKSNALMRCCKDLGIASELWDPNFIRQFKAKYCEEKFVEHVSTKRKRKIWKRKDRTIDYPYKAT